MHTFIWFLLSTRARAGRHTRGSLSSVIQTRTWLRLNPHRGLAVEPEEYADFGHAWAARTPHNPWLVLLVPLASWTLRRPPAVPGRRDLLTARPGSRHRLHPVQARCRIEPPWPSLPFPTSPEHLLHPDRLECLWTTPP